MQTCWLKLPPFREVANKLHEGFDEAIRVIYVASHHPANRQKSLTSASVKKSNKKRSSVQSANGLSRSALSNSEPYTLESSNSLTSDTANIIGSRRRGTKRHTNPDNCEDCTHAPVGSTSGKTQNAQEQNVADQTMKGESAPTMAPTNNTTTTKRQPIARSIGITASVISPISRTDLLFLEESPDFCMPSKSYNIRGTKGRECSENPKSSDWCEKLCCGRGYKTEVREEKYSCKCEFVFCCKLNCKQCTRRKVVHKCL